ncbi:GIY-YIG nuclease family protein [Alterinioella nitratireducens]|uniref:GIY-YIG nuclease family protein n=1 Tax=Alterinioella nitratireducens TaxID=2735915 RepID=UPI00405906A1
MNAGRSLELHFVDGNPEGMLTAEVFNWTGHVLRIPRTRLAEGLRRGAAAQTGVYLLIGEDEGGPLAYIGEAENVASRLAQHAKTKEWWDQAVIVTTAGDALHKAHVKYLESRLAEDALSAGAMRLENGNAPPRSSLNEAARANMESFLDTLHMVLPAIRVDLFRSGRRVTKSVEAPVVLSDEVGFQMTLPRHGITANALLIDGEMVVQAGSECRVEWVGDPSYNSSYAKLHQDLLSRGVVMASDGRATFTESFAFSSPSAAAAIISGRAANGRRDWKRPNGQTYADWEAAQLPEASP